LGSHLNWEEYFMGIALFSGYRSKDPSTKVGACIVNNDNHIVGIGYNGFPIGCSDELLPWGREGKHLDTKYPYVCHAELNAILNSTTETLKNCRIYVGLFPCNECAKAIIQSGIKEVIFLSDKYKDTDSVIASKKMFNLSGVSYRKMEDSNKKVTIDFKI
jgi:dCMP deaminase